jgi:hypothetical protein
VEVQPVFLLAIFGAVGHKLTAATGIYWKRVYSTIHAARRVLGFVSSMTQEEQQ